MTISFDLPPEITSRLDQKVSQEGQDTAEEYRALKPRVAGLHAGLYEVTEDFDAPLPEDFWLSAEGSAAAV